MRLGDVKWGGVTWGAVRYSYCMVTVQSRKGAIKGACVLKNCFVSFLQGDVDCRTAKCKHLSAKNNVLHKLPHQQIQKELKWGAHAVMMTIAHAQRTSRPPWSKILHLPQ
jgi:hypothetical protein